MKKKCLEAAVILLVSCELMACGSKNNVQAQNQQLTETQIMQTQQITQTQQIAQVEVSLPVKTVTSKEQLLESIYGDIPYQENVINYIATGFGSELNQSASQEKEGKYKALFSPETAAPYLLNLSGGTCQMIVQYENSTIVQYAFKNGESTHIQMVQPYGKDGIWLAQDVDVEDYESQWKEIDDWYHNIKIEDLNDLKQTVTFYEPETLEQESTFLMASLPANNIYLYGHTGGNGVILRMDDKLQLFNWGYTSPRGILPTIGYGDYDKDGQKELAVSLHTGTGTGVSVDQFYLVKFREDGSLQAMEFTPYQYRHQLEKIVTSDYDKQSGMLQFCIDNKNVGNTIDLSAYQEEGYEYEMIYMGDQIWFYIVEEEIRMYILPGFCVTGAVQAQYDEMPYICAKVNYNNGNFSLSDFKYDVTLE